MEHPEHASPSVQPSLGASLTTTQTKRFVCVAGNIGVGKTTVTNILEGALGFAKYEESVEGNPYLPLFYKDMRTWSYKLQRYFLMTRFVAHENIIMSERSVVQDRSIYEDMEVFAELQVQLGHFNSAQAERYRAFTRLMYDEIAPPDLLIFLRAPLPTLRERIARRNREYERDLLAPGNTYLAQLQELYDRWIASYTIGPKLVIETEELNFVENLSDVNVLIGRIQAALARSAHAAHAEQHAVSIESDIAVCSSAIS